MWLYDVIVRIWERFQLVNTILVKEDVFVESGVFKNQITIAI